MTGATSHLPLFPLNTVTFPGLTLPLHIFEDRYRQMLADVAKHEGPDRMRFTVTAIREGYEVGDTGVKSLYQIGAIVQVSQITLAPRRRRRRQRHRALAGADHRAPTRSTPTSPPRSSRCRTQPPARTPTG